MGFDAVLVIPCYDGKISFDLLTRPQGRGMGINGGGGCGVG